MARGDRGCRDWPGSLAPSATNSGRDVSSRAPKAPGCTAPTSPASAMPCESVSASRHQPWTIDVRRARRTPQRQTCAPCRLLLAAKSPAKRSKQRAPEASLELENDRTLPAQAADRPHREPGRRTLLHVGTGALELQLSSPSPSPKTSSASQLHRHTLTPLRAQVWQYGNAARRQFCLKGTT